MRNVMRFLMLFLLLGLKSIFLVSAQEAEVHKTTQMYAFDANLSGGGGIVSFAVDVPRNSQLLFEEESLRASAGAYARGTYYAALYAGEQPDGIYAYDLSTGEKTQMAESPLALPIISDMTYDYTSSTMYLLGDNYPNTTLMTLDLETGKTSVVATIDETLYTLACTPEGRLLAIGIGGMLYELDKETGERTSIVDLKVYTSGLQCMEFDYSNGKCYWVRMNYGQNYLYEIDMETYAIRETGSFPTLYQIVGLFPAHTAAVAGSPAAVENLRMTPGSSGLKECLVEWTNPKQTFGGASLSKIDKVKIYRNDTLIHTLAGATTGTLSSYTDKNVAAGYHSYKVIPCNEAGEGMWSSVSGYVGRDVPAAPSRLHAEKKDQHTVVLTWAAPESGLQGGWFDNTTLRYEILRLPDSVVLDEDFEDYEFTDENVTAYNQYTYQVRSVSADGLGGAAYTEPVFLGDDVQLPFFSSLENEASLAMWSLYNEGGNGKGWHIGNKATNWSTNRNGAESDRDRSSDNPLDNWMVSPPVRLEAGRAYLLSCHVRTAYGYSETLEIHIGQGNDPEGQSGLLCDTTLEGSYGKNIALPVSVEQDGLYYFSFRHVMEAGQGYILHLENIEFKLNDIGSLTGTVTDENGNPIADVAIALSDSMGTRTDKDGKFSYPTLIKGEYELTALKTGYRPYKEPLVIVALEEKTMTVELESLPYRTLTGSVTDKAGNVLAGANIEVSGYVPFRVFADENGTFEIDSIYESEDYTLRISKNGYEEWTTALPMLEDRDLEATVLSLKNLPPYSVEVVDTIPLSLQWEKPLDLNELAYDNGVPVEDRSLGYDVGSEYHIMAAIYREPSTVRRVKWYTRASASTNKADKYHVYLFDLDENGKPTDKKLYEKMNIEGVDEQWFTFELESSVDAPRGFMLALSGNGNVSLAIDTNRNPANQIPMTYAYSVNYTDPTGLTYFERNGWNYRLLLRAEVESYEPDFATPLQVGYNVWRFAAGDIEAEDKWTAIKENSPVATLSDPEFARLPQGIYRYAVRAFYPGENLTSDPAFSVEIPVKMEAKVTVSVSADDIASGANGAKVTLEDESGHAYSATVVNGKAVLNKVWKSEYVLEIIQEGYEPVREKVEIDEETVSLSYELRRILAPVDNLDVLETGVVSERKVLWNTFANIFDSFEDREAAEDFEINPASVAGWQYIDADGAPTYRFGNTTFPSSGASMAAVVFNPSATVPSHATKPYEGDRMLAFFCPSGGVPADDWLISPRLDFYKGFLFSFYARKFNDDGEVYNDERISVGYSTTTPDQDAFIWMDEEPSIVPTEWTSYAYKMPAEAKYVALRRQCEDGFILFVDNISIGVSRPEPVTKAGDTYRVYLDGKKIAETGETEYLLEGLENGVHHVGISKMYATGESETVTIAFSVQGVATESLSEANIGLYAEGDRLIIRGDYREFALFDVLGHLCLSDKTGKREFSLKSLPSGIYMARMTDKAGNVSVTKIFIR